MDGYLVPPGMYNTRWKGLHICICIKLHKQYSIHKYPQLSSAVRILKVLKSCVKGGLDSGRHQSYNWMSGSEPAGKGVTNAISIFDALLLEGKVYVCSIVLICYCPFLLTLSSMILCSYLCTWYWVPLMERANAQFRHCDVCFRWQQWPKDMCTYIHMCNVLRAACCWGKAGRTWTICAASSTSAFNYWKWFLSHL